MGERGAVRLRSYTDTTIGRTKYWKLKACDVVVLCSMAEGRDGSEMTGVQCVSRHAEKQAGGAGDTLMSTMPLAAAHCEERTRISIR